jgi:polysaccharide biosynthesis PFTS motif protein
MANEKSFNLCKICPNGFGRGILRMTKFDIFTKKKRETILTMMRGYRRLRDQGTLEKIEDLQQLLRDHKLDIRLTPWSPIVFGNAAESAGLIIRQLLSAYTHSSLPKALLRASDGTGKKIRMGIPLEWRRIIESAGFAVDHFSCSLLWSLYLAKGIIVGVAQMAVSLFSPFFTPAALNRAHSSHVVFCDLRVSNFPEDELDQKKYCILNWYCNWPGRDKDVNEVRHTVGKAKIKKIFGLKITYQRTPTPSLQLGLSQLKYCYWAFRAAFFALGALLVGRWWYSLALREAATAATIPLQSPKRIAKQYFFHNSRFYPPLWTYEVQKLGKEVCYYFYSTNTWPLPRSNGLRSFCTPYSIMNWPSYLAWNAANCEFIKRCDKNNPKITVVGPIWFESGMVTTGSLPSSAVAVFDVQPHRESLYRSYGLAREYYVPDVAIKFLEDVTSAAETCNLRIMFKRKREIGKNAHPKYRRVLTTLASKDHVCTVHPDVSAFEIVEKSLGVISMPFTSTAIAAMAQGKPSVYYDPTGVLFKSDPAASGVEVITDPARLSRWLDENCSPNYSR